MIRNVDFTTPKLAEGVSFQVDCMCEGAAFGGECEQVIITCSNGDESD